MAIIGDIISFNNPLYSTYVFYSCVLVIKMILMSFLTGSLRKSKKVFSNPEDAKAQGVKVRVDDDVERVRRAHLNDIENIPLFLFVSGLYILTGPSVGLATILFRAFAAARIVHTIVYAVVVVPQPARGLAWGVGVVITLYMAISTLLFFASGV